MKILILIALMLSMAAGQAAEDEKWVGVWVWSSKDDKKPGYWMGTMKEADLAEIQAGGRTKVFVPLDNVCYWDSDKLPGDCTKWYVRSERDEVDSGIICFRIEKIDKLKLLNKDPRPVVMIKDKNGDLVIEGEKKKAVMTGDNM